ncbi:MAG: phage tail sheath family protein [Candidatus Gastranaerophilaceae bacterium]
MTYFHGTRTKEETKINLSITEADMSSVLIIGTAPTYLLDSGVGAINKITNFQEMAKYVGNNIDGFTLADSVDTVLKESGGAEIYTINIFDNVKHTDNVDKSITFSNGVCVLEELGVQNLVVKKGNDALNLGTDYDFDNVTNTISILAGGAIETNQDNVTAAYKYVDLTKITDSDVIGTTDANGIRTGVQKIWDIMAVWGKIPGIIIAPGFTSKNIKTALENIAEELRGFIYFDIPNEMNVQTIEKARLKEQNGIDLTGSSEYLTFCYPYQKKYNAYQNTTSYKPLSPFAAGARVRLDKERNIGKSIDNTPLKSTLGNKIPISFKLNKADTDANRLNALGITTVINHNGTYYLWGGRNSSVIQKTGVMTFENARRTRSFINESIENTTFVCIGENITRGFIDDILNMINNAFAKWSNPVDKDNFIIYGGEAYYDPALNTAETIANGQIRIPYEACPLVPAEDIEFHDILNINIITKTING